MEGNPPVILDCDILSTFAKTNRITLLESLFQGSNLLMPDAVFVEIERVFFSQTILSCERSVRWKEFWFLTLKIF